MIISLAVFGRELFTLEIGRRVFLEDEPDGSSRVVLGTAAEFADDEGDFEDHAYEERAHPFGFSPGA